MTTPASSDVIDRLAAHRMLGRAPREELAWLAAHGSLRHLNVGDVLTAKGATVEGMYIVLSGRVGMSVDRGAGLHKVREWRDGDVVGVLPYSRLTSPPGSTIAEVPTEILKIDRGCLRDVILECHEVTSILVHEMVDRARAFTQSDLHDEKMVSLGKLSAGLAHELNNPASAIERSAALLDDRVDDADRFSRELGTLHLTEAELAAIRSFWDACVAASVHGVRSGIQQAEREDAIADWLRDHKVDTAIADALAETAVTVNALDQVARALSGPRLAVALRWAAAGCSVRRLASELQEAATRISGLVTAVKGFTHMDQATIAEPVDLVQGLSATVAVLRAKARTKSAAVDVTTEDGLPPVRGFAGELNQIWANLLDNALDAIPDEGRVDVIAARDGDRVAVRIVDNGPGIPKEIRERIFDPFFTTKPTGAGIGLGLDIVRRLLVHNDAEIALESQPGRTEFKVMLPVADAEPGSPR